MLQSVLLHRLKSVFVRRIYISRKAYAEITQRFFLRVFAALPSACGMNVLAFCKGFTLLKKKLIDEKNFQNLVLSLVS